MVCMHGCTFQHPGADRQGPGGSRVNTGLILGALASASPPLGRCPLSFACYICPLKPVSLRLYNMCTLTSHGIQQRLSRLSLEGWHVSDLPTK